MTKYLQQRSRENYMKQITASRKLRTYCTFKTIFGPEKYLYVITNPTIRQAVTKFRTSAHNLRIEKGRHYKETVDERLCQHCNLNQIEDELHFLLVCPLYKDLRDNMLTQISKCYEYFTNLPQRDKLIWLLSNPNENILLALGNFIYLSMEIRKNDTQSIKSM